MKKSVLSAVFVGAAASVFVGNVAEPIIMIAHVVVMEETPDCSSTSLIT